MYTKCLSHKINFQIFAPNVSRYIYAGTYSLLNCSKIRSSSSEKVKLKPYNIKLLFRCKKTPPKCYQLPSNLSSDGNYKSGKNEVKTRWAKLKGSFGDKESDAKKKSYSNYIGNQNLGIRRRVLKKWGNQIFFFPIRQTVICK